MFERYTEQARRVIFFARYEASQYGSPYIETEHLLLGLLREDRPLAAHFPPPFGAGESLRKEIESRTTIRARISTSVEVPLSHECRRILTYAVEEADRMSHRHVGSEHLLLAILREEKSLAAELLRKHGLELAKVREWAQERNAGGWRQADSVRDTIRKLASACNEGDVEALAELFIEQAEFVDVRGFLWKGREKVAQAFAAVHAPGSGGTVPNASPDICMLAPNAALVHLAWEKADQKPEPRGVHTMLVMTEVNGQWRVRSAQSTEVSPPPAP